MYYTTVANTLFIITTETIFLAFFGYIFLNEETTFIQVAGIVTIIFSAYMFSNKDS